MLKTRETRVEERKEEKRSEKRDRILRAAEAEDHQADFFISTAATIRRYQDLGARDVLTASSPFSKNPNRSEGSL